MFDFDLLIAITRCQCLSRTNGFLRFLGKPIDVHSVLFARSILRSFAPQNTLPLSSWLHLADFGQFFEEFLLAFSRITGHDDLQLHIFVTAAAVTPVQSLASQSQSLPALRP